MKSKKNSVNAIQFSKYEIKQNHTLSQRIFLEKVSVLSAEKITHENQKQKHNVFLHFSWYRCSAL